MQRAMVKCNGVPTQVITEGRWIEEGLSDIDNKDVVVIIPGNPGVPEFYEGFIKSLKAKLPTETPVWVVGHAGHVQPPDNLLITMPRNSTWHDHYSLRAQLEHKVDFIKKYVPKDAKLHLIGHSIGCWLILNLLKDDSISQRIKKCYMLFPVIEHVQETRNGRFFTSVVSRIAFLLVFLSWVFSWFPPFLQVFLLYIFGPFFSITGKHHKAVLQLLNPRSLKRVLKMAKEEMEILHERDDDVLSQQARKLWFYYGNCDGWTPVRYYKNMTSKHPDVNAELCKRNIHHSFVLQFEKEMGQIVGDQINENINNMYGSSFVMY